MALWNSKIVATHAVLPGIHFTGKGEDMKDAEHRLRLDILAFVNAHGDRDELRKMIAVFNRDKGTIEKLQRVGFEVEILNKTKKGVKTYG